MAETVQGSAATGSVKSLLILTEGVVEKRGMPRASTAVLVLACAAVAVGMPHAAAAQARSSPTALEPLALPALLPQEILQPSLVRSLSLVFRPVFDVRFASGTRRSGATRLQAYGIYRAELQRRAREVGLGPLAPPAEAPNDADAESGLDVLLSDLPGGDLLLRGRSFLHRLDASTRLGLEGYRVQVRVGDALDGRLAVEAQKRLP